MTQRQLKGVARATSALRSGQRSGRNKNSRNTSNFIHLNTANSAIPRSYMSKRNHKAHSARDHHSIPKDIGRFRTN